MKMRDPITSTAAIVGMLTVILQSSGLAERFGASSSELTEMLTAVVTAILAIISFFAKDSDGMRKIPGAKRLTAAADKPTPYERLTGETSTAQKP